MHHSGHHMAHKVNTEAMKFRPECSFPQGLGSALTSSVSQAPSLPLKVIQPLR